MKKLQRYRGKDPITVGPASDKLLEVFALSAGRSPRGRHHSGLHVLLNLTTGIADEMRLAHYDWPLSFRFPSPEGFGRIHHEVLIDFYRKLRSELVKFDHTRLLTPELVATQLQTEALHPEEIAAHRKLAREFGAEIERKTGKPYWKMTAAQVGELVVAQFDLSAQVAEIRDRYLSDRNRRVDEMSALALEDRSWQLRQQHMPLPNSRWFGPQKRYFG